MHNCLHLLFLLSLTGVAGCATQTPPSPAPQPPPITTPNPFVAQPFFTQTGVASFYGSAQDGKATADGEHFDKHALTAAHRTLAFGTVVRVTNLSNGRTVIVEINDRGPEVKGRIIDLSLAAARVLDMENNGVTQVRLEAFRTDQPEAAL